MRDKLFEMLGATSRVHIAADSPWYEYLNQMVQRHPMAPAKIGPGIKAFTVLKTTRMGNTYPELFIERVDGTTMDISWRKCEKGRDHSQALLFTSAMRIAVEEQIASFRKSVTAGNPCGFCGRPVGPMAHIDHERPFADILRAFMQGKNVPAVAGEDERGRRIISDGSFIAAWQAYHLEHASLRPAHPTCNLNPTSASLSSIYIEKGTFEGKNKTAKKSAPKWDSGMAGENQEVNPSHLHPTSEKRDA